MRPRLHTFLCLLLPLALAAATLHLLSRSDLAPFTDPELIKALAPSVEEEIQQAERRWEAKRQVTCELLDGGLTLRQAAARFRAIDVDVPFKARAQRPPGYTEEEWACRQVIAFVEGELAGIRQAPAQAKEWVTRLEAELRGHPQPGGAPTPAGEP